MRLLVLGGTRFVGRAVVNDALSRGWDVTVLNRGATASPPEGVRTLTADRTSYAELTDVLGDATWDLVVDTWAGAPSVVRDAAGLLADRTDRHGYVSTRSVYVWPPAPGADETAPLVDADPDADRRDYATDKRGGELAALREYGESRVLMARAGLILGPYEDVGRLPWWLGRIARGGRVVAPGDPGRGLQYVDARDLATWLLDNLERGASGPVDIVCPRDVITIEDLLNACIAATGSDAELVWVPEEVLEEEAVEGWTQLPCWVPSTGELAGMMESDTAKAVATGLRCRPVTETVRDTWEWVTRDGMPPPREGLPLNGLPAELEKRLLAKVAP
jgi:nucleoside-diphosphate-sugar epimerase